MAVFTSVTLALMAASQAFANPILLERQTGQCTGQSCDIASVSGSSGIPYTKDTVPSGGTYSGDCCIISYNPEYKERAYAAVTGLEQYCEVFGSGSGNPPITKREVEKRQTVCMPKTLIYARGTLEIAPLGYTVGPDLQSSLNTIAPGVWSVQGVQGTYDPSFDGDECLGLPGGVAATQLIEQVASECPNTKIVLSGYSQGAMVIRNGLARSNAASRIAGVVTFGDPFDGAPIKGYYGPILTYCAEGDGVCSGELNITAAHLSYAGANTTDAAMKMNRF